LDGSGHFSVLKGIPPMLVCEDAGPGIAPLFIGLASDRAEIERQEDEDAAHCFIERTFDTAEFTAFCEQTRACTSLPLTNAELHLLYARHTYGQQAAERAEESEAAERDALDERQRIAGEAAEYSSGIASHVAFSKAHDFLDSLEQKSRRTYHCAEFAGDLAIAARHALRNDLTAYAFYQLWAEGRASDIPAHVLVRSVLWYRIRSLVGDEIIRRGLLNGYFRKTRKKRRNPERDSGAVA
jgi:hypothetical protein